MFVQVGLRGGGGGCCGGVEEAQEAVCSLKWPGGVVGCVVVWWGGLWCSVVGWAVLWCGGVWCGGAWCGGVWCGGSIKSLISLLSNLPGFQAIR